MRNTTILIIVALLGILLGLRYLSNKNQPAAVPAPSSSAQQQPEAMGVALPQGAAAVPAPADYSQTAVPPVTNSAEPVPAFVSVEDEAKCSGGSVHDLMADQEKTWGRTVSAANLADPGMAQKLYDSLSQYLSCKAVAQTNLAVCNSLPSTADKGSSPRAKCVENAGKVLFSAYMAGKYTSTTICQDVIASNFKNGNIRASEFCPVAQKGMENICKGAPAAQKARCLKAFPATQSDCKGDENCMAAYSLYLAMKNSDPMRCQQNWRPFCGALATRSKESCSDLATEASATFCAYKRMVEDSKKPALSPKFAPAKGE